MRVDQVQWVRRLPWARLARWWIVGLAFYGGGLAVLYVFMDVLKMPLFAGTLLAAEATLLLRFLINDRWVFRNQHPTWIRLWQFHLASAGGSVIWWIVANILPRFGVHYLIASTAGTASSVLFSMATNFLWVWRGRDSRLAAAAPKCSDGVEATHVD